MIDYKGQPQSETRGGQLHVLMARSADYNLYDWAKRADKRKDGKVLFQTKTTGTVVEISFENAQCIRLTKKVGVFAGTKTNIIISPAIISLNGVTHNNRWRE